MWICKTIKQLKTIVTACKQVLENYKPLTLVNAGENDPLKKIFKIGRN